MLFEPSRKCCIVDAKWAGTEESAVQADLLWCQVSHSSGHLVSSRNQFHDLQTGQRNWPGAAPVLQPGWSASAEVIPQVSLWGVFHEHIQRPWRHRWGLTSAHRARLLTHMYVTHSPSWVQAPSRLMMFLCLPIIFIISISEMRSARSFSVASAAQQGHMTLASQECLLW